MSGTPMGPGFFIFFQQDGGQRQGVPLYKKDDEDLQDIEIIKIVFSFLENGDRK